jgi:hypothetical protein
VSDEDDRGKRQPLGCQHCHGQNASRYSGNVTRLAEQLEREFAQDAILIRATEVTRL